jgi:N-methylhydantoinase A
MAHSLKLSRRGEMILGIDVGGTHTDAVLFENFTVKKKTKVPTNTANLIDSLLGITDQILKNEDLKKLERVVFSTTICTNAIVQGKADRVGMILACGPGLSPAVLKINDDTHFVSGYMNHRGIEIASVNKEELSGIKDGLKKKGVRHVGIVGKFCTRNPRQELDIRAILNSEFEHISLGHRMSGNLNFRRRTATTYLNASIHTLYSDFVKEIRKFAGPMGLDAPIYILKADGGTFEIGQSVDYPAQTILSGPAASIMGILSLTDCRKDAIAMDIGGTTTDIALFADGAPLLEPLGVTIQGHKTLIRGLKTKSIGLGGDSRVRCEGGALKIGPEREGPAAAFGGPYPTPTDAMIILNLIRTGNRKQAEEAVRAIAGKMNLPLENAAERIFDQSCRMIASTVSEMIEEINNQPVYTIHEYLEGKKILPETLYIVGGPAGPMAPRIGELLHCSPIIPDHAEVANAIGAALARTTAEITLLADTEKKILTIVEEGERISIPAQFGRSEALEVCRKKLRERAVKMGAMDKDIDIEIVEDQEFNMVREYRTTGKNIRIKAQIKPGLLVNTRQEDKKIS